MEQGPCRDLNLGRELGLKSIAIGELHGGACAPVSGPLLEANRMASHIWEAMPMGSRLMEIHLEIPAKKPLPLKMTSGCNRLSGRKGMMSRLSEAKRTNNRLGRESTEESLEMTLMRNQLKRNSSGS